MKNILEEKPSKKLYGRLRASAELVDDADIANKVILDIGCGYGWCEVNFLERKVKKIMGIEVSYKDLSTAKKYVKDKRASFKVGSAINIPFPDKSFDTVVSWEVIEHIPKSTENKMFMEVSRVLKDGGVFYISTPYRNIISNILDPAWWLIGHRHYSKDSLKAFGYQNSLKIKKVSVKGRAWSLIGILNMYLSKWIFRRRPFFENHFRKKSDIEYSHTNGYATIFCKYMK